ncbi:MAG: hypothetical protein WC934_13895 [Acidithiobacillus sp.]|jgi:hypothetical protein|uniref:hypothetical protein n=1 Tax=Acidithiobacillus sp. TaxID=1872118 RepID=UPI00355E43B5
MRIICKKRQEGKTTELLEWALNDSNRIIVVCNYNYAKELQKYVSILRDRIFTYNDIFGSSKKLFGKPHDIEIGIDNLDQFKSTEILEMLFFSPHFKQVTCFTTTYPNEDIKH